MLNRRKYHRIPAQDEPCTVFVDSVQLTGNVVDESISGAGIRGLDLLMMPYNKQLSLTYRDEKIDVHARHVGRNEDADFVLGVVRSEELDKEDKVCTEAMLINCYVQQGDAFLICMPLRIESETHVLIQLWDGVQFVVPRQQLNPLSRLERFALLGRDHNARHLTVAMYGFQPVSAEFDRQRIFEFEFGQYANCPVAKQQMAVAR